MLMLSLARSHRSLLANSWVCDLTLRIRLWLQPWNCFPCGLPILGCPTSLSPCYHRFRLKVGSTLPQLLRGLPGWLRGALDDCLTLGLQPPFLLGRISFNPGGDNLRCEETPPVLRTHRCRIVPGLSRAPHPRDVMARGLVGDTF